MSPDQWTPGRLNDRFHALDRDLEHLAKQVEQARHQTEAFAPLVVTVETLKEDVKSLKTDYRQLDRSFTDLLRAARSETLKQLATVFGVVVVAVVGALLSGRL